MSCSCVMCHVSRGRVPSTCAHDSCRASLTSRNMADGKSSVDGRLSAVHGQTSPVSDKVSRCIHGSTFPPYFLSPLKLTPSRSSEVAQKGKFKHYAAAA